MGAGEENALLQGLGYLKVWFTLLSIQYLLAEGSRGSGLLLLALAGWGKCMWALSSCLRGMA